METSFCSILAAYWKLIFLIGETPFEIIALKAYSIGHLVRGQFYEKLFHQPTAGLWHKQDERTSVSYFSRIGRARVLLAV